MLNNTEIQPALTAEAWRAELEKLLNDGLRGVPRWRSLDSNIAQRRGTHALAALALHDQPFGFTQADVDALRACTNPVLNCEDAGWHTVEHRDRLAALAARIAALLPPE